MTLLRLVVLIAVIFVVMLFARNLADQIDVELIPPITITAPAT